MHCSTRSLLPWIGAVLAGTIACSEADLAYESDLGSSSDAITGWWMPPVRTTWDWQLATPVNIHSANVDVYDIDLFDNSASVVAKLHALRRKVICYIDVGSWEHYRPDAKSFPTVLLGNKYSGFADKRWLDIRRTDLLGPIMEARFDLAKSRGCDGIEPDNVDGYDTTAHESTGFPLTYADQITYNRWIASLAHARVMAVGLKNDVNQTQDLVNSFDYAVSEQCSRFGQCGSFTVFINAGKPVFEAEYSVTPAKFCPKAIAANISAIRKHPSLNAYRVGCWP